MHSTHTSGGVPFPKELTTTARTNQMTGKMFQEWEKDVRALTEAKKHAQEAYGLLDKFLLEERHSNMQVKAMLRGARDLLGKQMDEIRRLNRALEDQISPEGRVHSRALWMHMTQPATMEDFQRHAESLEYGNALHAESLEYGPAIEETGRRQRASKKAQPKKLPKKAQPQKIHLKGRAQP